MARFTSRLLRRFLLGTLVALLALTLLRSFVADVYRVDSTSMEPTLHATPEQVLVRFERGFRPERFDLVVFQSPGSGAVVKRAAGLPGESVLLSGGDLLIEGKRLPADVPRPEPITMFDSAREPLEAAFRTSGGTFENSPEGGRLDATGRRVDLTYSRAACDDRIAADGERVPGTHPVNDLRLDGRFGFQGTGKLTLRLTEEADAFELELDVREGAPAAWRLQRRPGAAKVAVLATGELPAGLAVLDLGLENVDNHLLARVGDQRAVVDYDANTPQEGVIDEADRHLEPRVHLAAAGLVVRLERLLVSRDVFYTAEGPLGTGSPVSLGPDELFVLGDNSSDSHDSRWIGPVRQGELTGRAIRVVWPLSAARRLGGLRALRSSQVLGQ